MIPWARSARVFVFALLRYPPFRRWQWLAPFSPRPTADPACALELRSWISKPIGKLLQPPWSESQMLWFSSKILTSLLTNYMRLQTPGGHCFTRRRHCIIIDILQDPFPFFLFCCAPLSPFITHHICFKSTRVYLNGFTFVNALSLPYKQTLVSIHFHTGMEINSRQAVATILIYVIHSCELPFLI